VSIRSTARSAIRPQRDLYRSPHSGLQAGEDWDYAFQQDELGCAAMSKSIKMKNGRISFPIKTGDSATIPANLQNASGRSLAGIPEGMQLVVSLDKVEGTFSDTKELIVTCSDSLFGRSGQAYGHEHIPW
jgi:hypothetical protein